MGEVRTLGQFVEQERVIDWIGGTVAEINERAGSEAKKLTQRLQLPPVSCLKCTARKTCCMSLVVVRLYEGILVAAELKRANRDTTELRAQLLAAAVAMEAASP